MSNTADRETVEDIKARIERSLPPSLVADMQKAGLSLTLGATDATPAFFSDAIADFEQGRSHAAKAGSVTIDPRYADEWAEREQLEEMVSYRGDVTGVDHTIFISPKARTQRAPRIKVAINPPDSLDPSARSASITIHDGNVVAGEVPTVLLKQAQQFIALNRDVLLDYWDYRIDTEQLRKRLKSIKQSSG